MAIAASVTAGQIALMIRVRFGYHAARRPAVAFRTEEQRESDEARREEERKRETSPLGHTDQFRRDVGKLKS